MRQAIFERIANAVGPVTNADLLSLFPAPTDALAKAHADLVSEHLRELAAAKLISNIAPAGGKYAYWVKVATKAEPDADQPNPPAAWVGQPAPPRQYDVMDPNNVYVPPPSLRRGGKSVREELEDHATRQASYIPAL